MQFIQAKRKSNALVSVLSSKFISKVFFVSAVVTLPALVVPLQAQAQAPVCSSAAVDGDGDGWGWENNRSCVVQSSAGNSDNTTSFAAPSGTPVCSAGVPDDNHDGWGWENHRSCIISAPTGQVTQQSPEVNQFISSGTPVCSAGVTDDNNDGWGWENNRSCIISASAGQQPAQVTQQSTQASQSFSGGTPVCLSSVSDTNNDGWGFENGVSCIVTAASGAASNASSVATPGVAPPPVAAAVTGFSDGHPICLTDASDDGNNGFGYENNRTCRVVPGTTATRSQPLLNQRSCIDWLEIGYGNYRLQNNVWNAGAVYNNNWSQCIELTGGPGNYVAKWDYNWLPREQGNDFAVKSYPQVYYGRKTRFNLSGSVAETGLPVLTDRMPQFLVDYDYSETGIVERNVAFESFFHTSCDAEEYNKQYEMMVWVGKPTIRTPGTQVTTVTLSGEEWDVFINPSLGWAYVAFVARNPSNRGTLDWNDFVYWSRDQGPSFGVPAMANNVCMGAIELGTETFWGTGTFTLNRFQVRRG